MIFCCFWVLRKYMYGSSISSQIKVPFFSHTIVYYPVHLTANHHVLTICDISSYSRSSELDIFIASLVIFSAVIHTHHMLANSASSVLSVSSENSLEKHLGYTNNAKLELEVTTEYNFPHSSENFQSTMQISPFWQWNLMNSHWLIAHCVDEVSRHTARVIRSMIPHI